MAGPPVVEAVHTRVRGRARYRVSGLYRSLPLKEHLELRLAGNGVSLVSASVYTGKVLVVFNSHNTVESVATLIEDLVEGYRNGNGANRPAISSEKPVRKSRANEGERERLFRSRRKLRLLVEGAEEQKTRPWHLMEPERALATVGCPGEGGLSLEDAGRRLQRYGPNLLPESVPRSGWKIFFGQLRSLPVALLGAAAVLSVATGGVADAVIIMSVVGINALIGYVTESQAEKTINSLKTLVRPSASVLRQGRLREIPAEDVVPGDLLVLRPGSYVAADSRVLESKYLSIDESALTGESMPVMKSPGALETMDVRGDIPIADRTNMLYMGTLVTGGQGLAVVVGTGEFTELGLIQSLIGRAMPPDTPMEIQLRRVGNQLVFVSGAVCGLVFLIGVFRGYGLLRMLKTAISLAVAAVPEGLPTVATTTLALGIRDMRRHNILIRHLDAVESLGSIETICLDKTGTITLNRMSVVEVFAGARRFKVSDGRFFLGGELADPYGSEELLRLLHVSVLCNETEINGGVGEYALSGTSTENALIHMALSAAVDVRALRERHPRIAINHRSEDRNYMSTLHEGLGGRGLLAVKGSPAEVLAMCDRHIMDGTVLPMNDEDRNLIGTENERMAGASLRVLGVAYKNLETSEEDGAAADGLVWLGLVGMADPIREGVRELVSDFHEAGIDTVMITGDQSPTAYAVGRELDLGRGEQLEILDSTHLRDVEPEVLKALARRVHVFSRVSPAHKLQIVQALQGAGRTVAMTGDGINDGPALKAADIGIAMGHTGTDVAREVADVVVEDDRLETIVVAVAQGRSIYNNIRKSLHFLLSTNMSEIMVEFAAIAVGAGQPLGAMQLLWINLMSDIFPGLALALEPPEPDVLSRPPRDPGEPIIKRSDFKRISFESAALTAGSLGAFAYGAARYGLGPRANSLAFLSLTFGQLVHALSCRSEHMGIFSEVKPPPNPYLRAALGGSFALQALAMALPWTRSLLGITSIGLLDGLVIGGGALVPFVVNEATKKPAEGGPG